MAVPAAAPAKRFPTALLVVCALAVLALIGGLIYLSRPVPKAPPVSASAEAKAYLPHLELTGVTMKASENFMKQQVVEIEGQIANKGPRSLRSIDVYCVFYGVDGREVHRELVPMLPPAGGGLKSGQSRPFRLPFDSLPDTWNQALPHIVIARIGFAS